MHSGTPADAIDLAAVRDLRTTGVSRVLLEATVVGKAERFVRRPGRRFVPCAGGDEPQTIDLASVESLPVTYTLLVDASQSMHARMEFVRAAAGRLATSRPKDRIIVAPFARRSERITRADRRSRDDREAPSARFGQEARQFPIGSSRPRALMGAEATPCHRPDYRRYDENSQTKMEDALVARSRRTPRQCT